MQVSASITYLPSPSEMAETGHSSEQAPHATHSSLITYAIMNTSNLLMSLLYTMKYKNAIPNSKKSKNIFQKPVIWG